MPALTCLILAVIAYVMAHDTTEEAVLVCLIAGLFFSIFGAFFAAMDLLVWVSDRELKKDIRHALKEN